MEWNRYLLKQLFSSDVRGECILIHHSVSVFSYQDVVTAQFFSHTHLNEIQLFKDARERPFSVSYVAPSLTPWQNVNPGYRIYNIDGARGNRSSWVSHERLRMWCRARA